MSKLQYFGSSSLMENCLEGQSSSTSKGTFFCNYTAVNTSPCWANAPTYIKRRHVLPGKHTGCLASHALTQPPAAPIKNLVVSSFSLQLGYILNAVKQWCELKILDRCRWKSSRWVQATVDVSRDGVFTNHKALPEVMPERPFLSYSDWSVHIYMTREAQWCRNIRFVGQNLDMLPALIELEGFDRRINSG
jgi:hypothetical protein